MDAVWLILDSLSYDATPFSEDGPDTMPHFRALARDRGIVFHEAYAPGPLSPSSHASFFTGELPSAHGMHEAHPFFDGQTRTVADRLVDTHCSHLVSVNNFLFTGLERDFDETENFTNTYMLFEDAGDPRSFGRTSGHDSRWARYGAFLTESRSPLKSLLNGLNYKIQTKLGAQEFAEDIPKHLGDDAENYQYALTINKAVRDACAGDDPAFVVANYMDVHPPLAPSEEAVAAVDPDADPSDLPVGKPTERTTANAEKSFDVDDMYSLYLAAIRDLDRKVAPLIEELVDDGAFVAVLADHGTTYRNGPRSAERCHVPLVLFHPDEGPRSVERTVDLRALPRTTVEAVGGDASFDDGPSLLAADADDDVAITEIIYQETSTNGAGLLLNHDGTVPDDLHHDLVLRKGDSELVLADGAEERATGLPETLAELRRIGERLGERDLSEVAGGADGHDRATRERLADLGYIEEGSD